MAAAALALAVAACGGDDADSAQWLARYAGGVNGNDAGLRGTLKLEGRCLYAGSLDPPFLLVFPENSSFDEASRTLSVLGKDFKVGKEFRSGGNGEESIVHVPLLTPPDPSCDTRGGYWLVGNVD